ncbi:MAG: hypothetical protein J7501_14145 [Bdellovibrio sp.]|nr:hypothetical protein [Bdellovibrio sp.]
MNVKSLLMTLLIIFSCGYAKANAPMCQYIFSEHVESIQTNKDMMKFINTSIKAKLKSQPLLSRWFSPRQVLLIKKSQAMYLNFLIYEKNPEIRQKFFKINGSLLASLQMKNVDPEMLKTLQGHDFETFFTLYKQRYGLNAATRTSLSLANKFFSTATMASFALAIFWFKQSDDDIRDFLNFDSELSDANLEIFNRILDKSTARSNDEIIEALKKENTGDPEWSQFVGQLEAEVK